MRAVVQRVQSAVVRVEGRVTGSTGPGLLVFLGIHKLDTGEDLEWLTGKIAQARIFEDGEGKMNRPVTEAGGGILLISQFTLHGNMKKGMRPSFNDAGPPAMAEPLYAAAAARLGALLGRPVGTGVFGAHMEIEAHHDGPVTLILDSRQKDF